MYSLHYGTIPIVTRVGGLVDTVIDIDENPDDGTGIMTDVSADSLRKGLNRALALYLNKGRMRQIIKRAMSRDFSWSNLARANEALYRDMV
jgi:starch synthase